MWPWPSFPSFEARKEVTPEWPRRRLLRKRRSKAVHRVRGARNLSPNHQVRITGGWSDTPLCFLDRLDDLSGPKAPDADPDPLRLPVNQCPNRGQIRKPAVLGQVVSMADPMANHRAFPTDITPLSHTVLTPEPRVSDCLEAG